MTPRRREPPAPRPAPGLPASGWLLLAAAFLGAALSLYQPALEGPFLSDDIHYVRDNPYIHELSRENLAILLDPGGRIVLANSVFAELVGRSEAELLGADPSRMKWRRPDVPGDQSPLPWTLALREGRRCYG